MICGNPYNLEAPLPSFAASTEKELIQEDKQDLDTISLNYQSTCLLSLQRQDSLSLLDSREDKQQLLQCTRTDSLAPTKSDTLEDTALEESVKEVDADIFLRSSVCSSDNVSQKSAWEDSRYEIDESTLVNPQV